MQPTLSGTLFVYQGEEIGMRNVPKSWSIEECKDIESINFWKKSKALYGDDLNRLAQERKVRSSRSSNYSFHSVLARVSRVQIPDICLINQRLPKSGNADSEISYSPGNESERSV